MSRRCTILSVFAMMILGAAVLPALAQPAPGGAGGAGGGVAPAPGGAGGGAGGGRFDPAQMREQMNQRMKELMGATDDEWKVLQPKIEAVQQLQRDAASGGRGMALLFRRPGGDAGGGGGGGGRPGGFGGGPGGDRPPSAVQEKSTALQTAIENKDTPADDVKAKIAALREARAKAKAELTKAQDGLRELTTVRQEGVLIVLGVLE